MAEVGVQPGSEGLAPGETRRCVTYRCIVPGRLALLIVGDNEI
jgi:hypothetical protein